MFCLFLGLIALLCLGILYAFFGAGYEFIKCYKLKQNKLEEDKEEQEEREVRHYDIENPRSLSKLSSNRERMLQKSKSTEWSILLALFLLGILFQPFYLLFKFIELMMECYRSYGCFFGYFGNF